MKQMTFELLVETTAVHELGAVKFLHDTWGHLYPSAPPPKFRVFYSCSHGPRTEFTAAVYLNARPGADEPSYVLSSSITNQVTRALQEVSGDTLVFLRTHDPVMKVCTCYVYFPRLYLSNGYVLFPNPGGTTPAFTSLLQYTSHLHQYL